MRLVRICVAGSMASELWPNTDWQNENRLYERFKESSWLY